MIKEKKELEFKLIVLDSIKEKIFTDYNYNIAININVNESIKISGFIEIISDSNEKNTLIFYDNNYIKYFCDSYN